MKKLFSYYFNTSLLIRILIGFGIGAGIGVVLWSLATVSSDFPTTKIIIFIKPFGDIFVNMLKMIVIPIIFFSLVVGAASLPISRFGKIGLKVILWYFGCSIIAAAVGVALALIIDPGGSTDLDGWKSIAAGVSEQAGLIHQKSKIDGTFISLIMSMFQNPFSALAEGSFLAIIVFSILLGLAIRTLIEHKDSDNIKVTKLTTLIDSLTALQHAMFKIVDWILEYSPIGVFALSIVNFGLYGPKIVGPYISVTIGVILGILSMVFIFYPIVLGIVCRKNPYTILKQMEEAILTALITRSSAATLPVSIRTIEEKLKVKNELASFSLPLYLSYQYLSFK